MPRRKRSTWGTIERLGRDHWRLRWWEERDGVYARRSECMRGTRREAERRLAEIRASLDETRRGSRRPVRRLTVGEAWERWALPDIEARHDRGDLAKNTYANMMSKWRVHVAPRWAPVRCDDVRPLDIQAWLDGKTEKPAQDALAMLRQILDFATLYEVISMNVARRPYRMPTAHEDRSDGAFALAELDRIATASRGLYCEAAILLMCFGSCRVGESLAVRVGEVSRVSSHGLDLTTAAIVRQMNSNATLSEDGRLKNRQSVRTVVVPPPWGDRLWWLAGAAREAGDEWLCDGGRGRPASQYNLRNDWRRAVVGAGLPYRQPRAARRSWETYMRWEMGVEQSRIEQMMGHALPGVTGAHYDRPSSQAFVDVVAEAFARKPFRRT